MIQLILQSLREYMYKDHKRTRNSNEYNTVVVYEIVPKEGLPFTRIDIFSKQAKHV